MEEQLSFFLQGSFKNFLFCIAFKEKDVLYVDETSIKVFYPKSIDVCTVWKVVQQYLSLLSG